MAQSKDWAAMEDLVHIAKKASTGVTQWPVHPHVNEEKGLFLFPPPFQPGYFVCFFNVSWGFSLVFCFCNTFLVSLKYATPTFFTYLLYFNRFCRATQQA